MVQLGGHPVYTRGDEVGFDAREPVEDIARIMAGYHARDRRPRVRPHGRRAAWRRSPTVPVVNMLSDRSPPAAGARRRADDAAGARRRSPAAPSPTSATTTTSPARSAEICVRCSALHVALGCPRRLRRRRRRARAPARCSARRRSSRRTARPRRSSGPTPCTPTRGRRWARRTRRRRAGRRSRASPSTPS